MTFETTEHDNYLPIRKRKDSLARIIYKKRNGYEDSKRLQILKKIKG
jgi:hypothetical protein